MKSLNSDWFNNTIRLFVASLLLLQIACSQQDQATPIDCTGLTPTYTKDIRTILNASCAKSGCHDAFTQLQGVDLSNYSSASAISRTSSFLGTIEHKRGYNPMPWDAAKLSSDKIQLLACWVETGSPQ